MAGFADATGRYLPLVCTMNATKVTDAVARLLGVDHERFDELALEAPAGAGRPGARAALRRRADTEPTRCDRHAHRPAQRRHPGPAGPGRGRGSGVQPARRRPRHSVRRQTDGCSSSAARPGAPPTGASSPTSPVAPFVVPSEEELVAAGAAVQAAAVHLGCDFAQVGDAWGLGRGDVVEPDDTVDRVAIRAAYAEAAVADGRT